MKQIKLIIIDLDDTLIAFDVVTKTSWLEVCQEFTLAKPALNQKILYDTLMKKSRWFWSDPERHRVGRLDNTVARRKIVESVFIENSFGTKEEAYALADSYSQRRTENIFLFPMVYETLLKLKNAGFTLVMMTNGDSPTQRAKIERFQLAPYFEKIYVEGELGFGKPDQRVFQMAFDDAGVKPEESLIVGDNLKWEIGVPNELGMNTVWMNYTRRNERKASDPVPDREIHSIEELLSAVAGL